MRWSNLWRSGRANRLLSWLLLGQCILAAWMAYQGWQYVLKHQTLQQTQQYQRQQRQQHQRAIEQLQQTLGAVLIAEEGQWIGGRIENTLPLAQWQALLQTLQQRVWLTPSTLHWKREEQGWYGAITWHFVKPRTLKPQLNLMPLPLKVDAPQQGELVSTVQGEHAAALIKVNQHELWVQEGHWSPRLKATLAHVGQDAVILNDQRGLAYSLSFAGHTPTEAP